MSKVHKRQCSSSKQKYDTNAQVERERDAETEMPTEIEEE
jgi:hypothetical protein